jgi:uncharacterized membrane protein
MATGERGPALDGSQSGLIIDYGAHGHGISAISSVCHLIFAIINLLFAQESNENQLCPASYGCERHDPVPLVRNVRVASSSARYAA